MVMGRPRIEIDWVEFDKLCTMQCTLVEIAGWFECSEDTIERRIREKYDCTFAELFTQKRSKGKISLRRKQYETALKGNVAMLIWLGKQYLGQSDKQDSTINQRVEITPAFEIVDYEADDKDTFVYETEEVLPTNG